MEQMLALVTGGARSIGRACCEALLKDGYRVVFFDVDDVSAAEFLRVFAGGRLYYRHCDVSSFTAVEEHCRAVREQFGTVTVLVNNAGIQTHCRFDALTEELWDETLAINLKSAFCTCKCLVPGMVAQGYGRIVNIASMSARRGSRRHVHYCASKAGLLGFTRALSQEIAENGVTLNAVCPGIVESDMIRETLQEKREIWLKEMHVKRLGTPADIARAVSFLADRASGWITGQAFEINGGILTP